MTEADIIKKCKKGDRDAFDELVKMYQNKVVNIAYGMLSDSDDALDAAQEVFIKVYRGLDSFQEKSSFSTWIYRITSNVCADILRKRQRSIVAVSINQSEDEKVMEIKDDAPTPEEYSELSERQAAVREALADIKDEYREIITFFDIEGLSYEKISDILKIPVGTVKSRLNRARAALKKNLSKKVELF